MQKQGLAEHKSDKMSNEGGKPLKKGEKGVAKGVPKGRNMKITTNIITKQRKICINKSKMSLVGRRESSKGSVVGKYGRSGQKRREQKVEMQISTKCHFKLQPALLDCWCEKNR